MSDNEQDRRRAERAPVNREFDGLSATTFISDISELGVFIQTKRRMPLGMLLDLHFTVLLDDPVVLKGRGRVVRHQDDPSGMGIEFVDASPELMLRLSDVVARQRPRDLGPPLHHVGDDDVTRHRATMPIRDVPDPDLDSQKTGVYPSIRIHVSDPEGTDPGLHARVDTEGLALTAGQSMQDMSLAEVSAARRAHDVTAQEIEELWEDEPPARPRTLDLQPTDVEIVDDAEDEGEGR